jgi:hypothetical protein
MRSLSYLTRRRSVSTTAYQLTDRLHEGRTAYVSADEIVSAVSTWLAELSAHSPFVEDLAHSIAERRLGGCAFDCGSPVR